MGRKPRRRSPSPTRPIRWPRDFPARSPWPALPPPSPGACPTPTRSWWRGRPRTPRARRSSPTSAGAGMVGLTAPGRRVGFFLHDTTAASLTTSGRALLDAALRWATGAVTRQPRMGPGAWSLEWPRPSGRPPCLRYRLRRAHPYDGRHEPRHRLSRPLGSLRGPVPGLPDFEPAGGGEGDAHASPRLRLPRLQPRPGLDPAGLRSRRRGEQRMAVEGRRRPDRRLAGRLAPVPAQRALLDDGPHAPADAAQPPLLGGPRRVAGVRLDGPRPRLRVARDGAARRGAPGGSGRVVDLRQRRDGTERVRRVPRPLPPLEQLGRRARPVRPHRRCHGDGVRTPSRTCTSSPSRPCWPCS